MPSETSRPGSVVVIGASSFDVVSRVQETLQRGTSNAAVIHASFGGVARNVAENLARLGMKPILLSVVGKDQIGDDLIAATKRSGVIVNSVHRSEKIPTGMYVGIIDQNGKKEIAFADVRVLEQLTVDYIAYHEGAIAKADLIFIDANLSEPVLDLVFSIAQRESVPVFADPTSVGLSQKLLPYLRFIDSIIPNALEAEKLVGRTFPRGNQEEALECARGLVRSGVDNAFVSMAEFGLCYANSETSGHYPALKTNIVDPTGAGDAMTAAILYSKLNDIPIDDAARLGVSAATVTLKHVGSVDPNLSIELLYDEFLK